MPEKILIIHSGGIGDLLLALPAMRMFRQTFPHSLLELMGRKERLALVSRDLRASSIHSSDRAEMAYFYLEGASFPPGLSTLFSSFRTALVFGKAGGKILAENLKKAGIGRVISVPPFPPEHRRVHVPDYLIESLKKEGMKGENLFVPLCLPDEALAFGQSFWSDLGLRKEERVLAIHPGSGSPAKNWEPMNFAEVAGWASEESRVLLISGPAEGGIEEVRRAMKKAKPAVAYHLPLLQLAGALKSSTTYVGNDSGITHLAAGLGIPSAAIFGPTDPAVWGPWGPKVRIIYGGISGTPDSNLARNECSCPGLRSIEPAQVIEVLGALLLGSPQKDLSPNPA